MGFDGYPWHTHPDHLSPADGQSEQEVVDWYVRDLLENRAIIAVTRVGGRITYVNVTEDPVSETLHLPPGMSVELRYWNGTKWKSA